MFFFSVLPVAQKTYYQYTDTDDYVEYFSVEPLQEIFPVDSYPVFKSTNVYRQKVDIMRVDILYCKTHGGEYGIYKTSESKAVGYGPKPLGNRTWTFGKKGPNYPTDCFLKSNQKLYLPFGVEKTTETIESGPFSFR